MPNRSKVRTRVQGLPVAIRTQGLSVALATLLKEKNSESAQLAELMGNWLLSSRARVVANSSENASGSKLLARTIEAKRAEYLALQTESLAYLEHVKRIASALEND